MKENEKKDLVIVPVVGVPDWKDLSFKEKRETIGYFAAWFFIGDVILAGLHEDMPLFIQVPTLLYGILVQ